jgi:hypothetical protein
MIEAAKYPVRESADSTPAADHTAETSILSLPCLLAVSASEEAETYRAVVAILNPRWRVIECRNCIQWILQRSAGLRHGTTRWEGRCYCRTRECLLRRVRELAGEIEPIASAVLKNLPDWIGGRP